MFWDPPPSNAPETVLQKTCGPPASFATNANDRPLYEPRRMGFNTSKETEIKYFHEHTRVELWKLFAKIPNH
jgi:hypothetical protein